MATKTKKQPETRGRKRIGENRPLKITLPDGEWERIDKLIEEGHASSVSDYFRQLHVAQFK